MSQNLLDIEVLDRELSLAFRVADAADAQAAAAEVVKHSGQH